MSKIKKAERLMLKNSLLEIEINPENGSILGIKDKRVENQYIKHKKFARLFRLMLPSTYWDGQHADSWDQKTLKIERYNESKVILRFDSLSNGQRTFAVDVVVSITLNGDTIVLKTKLKNRGPEEITDVIFPWIGGLGKISKSETDAIYLPGEQYRKIQNPLETLGRSHYGWNRMYQKFSRRYLGTLGLATSWVDYSSKECGLGIDVRSKTFEPQDFYAEGMVDKDVDQPAKIQKTLSLGWCFHPHISINEEWESPDVIVRVHLGDWHIVADEHRKWVERWIHKPNLPKAFAKSIGWHFYFMKHQDGTVVNTYDDLPKMAKSSLAAGIPYIMLFGWQKRGHDNHYPFGYFPNEDWGGLPKLKKKINEIKGLGCEPIPFLNFTLMDTQTKEYKDFAHKWAVKSRTGGKYFGGDWSRCNFDIPFRTAGWLAASSRSMLCVDLCLYRESIPWFIETAKRLVFDYGFGNLQLDQIGHKFYCCYNPEHKHEKPQYAFPRGIAAVLTEIRDALREQKPEAVIIGEGVNEFVGQYCDSHWTWNQLDHPEPLRFSIPWLTYSHEIDALEYGDVNKCFAYKIMMDLKIDGGDGYILDFPKFTEHLKKLSDLKSRVIDVYVDAYFRDEEGIDFIPRKDGAIAKVYRNLKNDRTGIVIANTTAEKTKLEVTMNLDLEGKEVSLYHLNGSVKQMPTKKKVGLELASYDIQILAIR